LLCRQRLDSKFTEGRNPAVKNPTEHTPVKIPESDEPLGKDGHYCQKRETVMPVGISEMGEREFYAALAMQALINRVSASADLIAQQAVAYADALMQALAAKAPKPLV
jgi:hypothetical protein